MFQGDWDNLWANFSFYNSSDQTIFGKIKKTDTVGQRQESLMLAFAWFLYATIKKLVF